MSLGAGNLLLASAGDTGYNLTRSVRLRASASANLSQTITTSATWALSVWVKRGVLSAISPIFGDGVKFLANDTLTAGSLTTTAVYRDPSSWYHLYVSNLGLYINGVLLGSVTTSALTNPRIGSNGTNYFDGELAEFNFINGATPAVTAFGSFDAITGVWKAARYSGSYPTGSSYVPFTDNSALTTSSNVGLGKDFSGNGNYWTTNNISITAGVTYDSMTDVPTLTSATAANFAVLNPLINKNSNPGTFTNGNLINTANSSSNFITYGTIAIDSSFPKIYWEVKNVVQSADTNYPLSGIANIADTQTASIWFLTSGQGVGYYASGTIYNSGTNLGSFTAPNTGTVMFAYDPATGKFWVGTGGVWQNSGNPAAGTGQIATLATTNSWLPVTACSSSGTQSATNFGQQPFTYTPPTGFVALNTYNLPTSTILKGNTVMDATLYSGNSSTQNIVNAAAFKPDLVWPKARSVAYNNTLYDSVRGATKTLFPNLTNAEVTEANTLTAFNSNGFSLGSEVRTNESGNTYVAWQWQAGQGSTSSNTSGSITSTVSVNASAGFSIVTWTGNLTNSTVGHGLGVAPQWIVVKNRTTGNLWPSYHVSATALGYLALNTTAAYAATSVMWNNTAPTSSVFTVGTTGAVNNTSDSMVAYCWTPIAGYSAFGSYTGNGSTDGTFVYTGFKPKFVIVKMTSSTGDWYTFDSVRDPYNATQQGLSPNSSASETTYTGWGDLLSNGFKIRRTDAAWNASGGTYVYMAFAESPFRNSLAR